MYKKKLQYCLLIILLICFYWIVNKGLNEPRKEITNLIDYSKITTTKNTGHRGYGCCLPENSIIAIQKAFSDAQVDAVEIDIMLSKDKIAIAFHDQSLKRIALIDEQVANLNWDTLKDIDIGQNYPNQYLNTHIPTLEAVFNEVIKFDGEIILDIKTQGMANSIQQALEKTGIATNKVWYWSGDYESLVHLNSVLHQPQILMDLPRGSNWESESFWKKIQQDGVVGFSIYYTWLNKEFFYKAKSKGFFIDVYTVNNEKDMHQLVELGVDSIETDHPEKLKSVLIDLQTNKETK